MFLTCGIAKAVGAVVVTFRMGVRQYVEWSVVSGANNFIDLAKRFFVVQIVNFLRVRVAEVSLTIHISCVSSHCVFFGFEFSFFLSRRISPMPLSK